MLVYSKMRFTITQVAMAAKHDFEFEVKRSHRRKTLCLQIRDGHIQVMVPARTPERQIQILLEKHTPWINKKLEEQAARPSAAPRAYVEGEIYSYLGQDHRLRIIEGPPWPTERVGLELIVTLPARSAVGAREAKVRDRLCEWYRQSALEEFRARTENCARRLGLSPQHVNVKAYRRRWGSCSASGEISYNWRLIMAPTQVVDYVVAHEVVHLVQHNHSPDFWRIVERLMPDYRHQQTWLNKNGGTLAL